jgi:hypothetical protein
MSVASSKDISPRLLKTTTFSPFTPRPSWEGSRTQQLVVFPSMRIVDSVPCARTPTSPSPQARPRNESDHDSRKHSPGSGEKSGRGATRWIAEVAMPLSETETGRWWLFFER